MDAGNDIVQLSKTLAFVLRHGAAREPTIQIFKGGYMLIVEFINLPQLSKYSHAAILNTVEKSISKIDGKSKRYELLQLEDKVFIRASYGHSFKIDKYPPPTEFVIPFAKKGNTIIEDSSEESRIPKLLDMCVAFVGKNLKKFTTLNQILDGFLLNKMLQKFKAEGKITNQTIKLFLIDIMDDLDLEGFYVSDSTLKRIGDLCPSLVSLNLKGNPTTITNNSVQQLVRKCNKLKLLNISDSKYINDEGIYNIVSKCTDLTTLDISNCMNVSEVGIKNICTYATNLVNLNISRCTKINEAGIETLATGLMLQTLDLSWNATLTDASLNFLANNDTNISLNSLTVCHLHLLTEVGIKNLIQKCTGLRFLNIQHCDNLKSLVIEGTNVRLIQPEFVPRKSKQDTTNIQN